MVHSTNHVSSGPVRGHASSARAARDAAGRGAYAALLATAGFIIVGLLRIAERRDERAERRGR